MGRKVLTRWGLGVLMALTTVAATLVVSQPAQANALRCRDNWSGELCLMVYNSGATVSRVRGTLEYHNAGCSSWRWGLSESHYMYFTVWGTLSNGSSYYVSGSGRCDDGTYGMEDAGEYRNFVVDRTFRHGSKLCLRADYLAPTSNDPYYACYVVP